MTDPFGVESPIMLAPVADTTSSAMGGDGRARRLAAEVAASFEAMTARA